MPKLGGLNHPHLVSIKANPTVVHKHYDHHKETDSKGLNYVELVGSALFFLFIQYAYLPSQI